MHTKTMIWLLSSLVAASQSGCSSTNFSGAPGAKRERKSEEAAVSPEAPATPVKDAVPSEELGPEPEDSGLGGAEGDDANLPSGVLGEDHAEAFRRLRPVLAVRQPACFSCHAQINGDLVSDFMANEPDKFVGSKTYHLDASDRNARSHGTQSLRFDTFANMNINGSLIVPKVAIDDESYIEQFFPETKPETLAEALAGEGRFFNRAPDLAPTGVISKGKLFSNIGPDRNKALPGVNAIEEMTSVSIHIPKEKELLDLFAAKAQHIILEQSGATIQAGTKDAESKGIETITGSKGIGFALARNAVTCKGDLFITGSLVFAGAVTLHSDARGCRLYVVGTVFVQGTIDFAADSDKNATLQIVTSRPVLMGLKSYANEVRSSWSEESYDKNTLSAEIANLGDHVTDTLGGPFLIAWKDSKSNPIAYSHKLEFDLPNAVNADLDSGAWAAAPGQAAAGLGAFQDCRFVGNAREFKASDNPKKDCVFARNDDFMRPTVNFRKVLFVTPLLRSRIHGTFTGSIVAEVASFPLGATVFNYDSVFQKVTVLPLLDQKILDIVD